jgi:hypothetical protein
MPFSDNKGLSVLAIDALRGARTYVAQDRAIFLQSGCDRDADGNPIRSTLPSAFVPFVERAEQLLADIDVILAGVAQ